MAGNAQNKLGELFVDIGVGGLGKTLKGLNSISASFLLTKNAAQQAVQPILNMTKQSGVFALNIDKMSNNLGIATREMQKFHYALKEKGVDESVLTSFKNISDTIFNFQERGVGLTSDMAFALNQLHLNLFDYSSDWKGVSEYIDDVGKAIKGLPIEEQRVRLKQLQLPEEMLYYYKQFPGGVSTATSIISDEKLNKILQVEEERRKTINELENIKNEIVANLAEPTTKGLRYTQNLIKDTLPFLDENQDKLKTSVNFVQKHPYLGKLLGGPLTWMIPTNGKSTGQAANLDYNMLPNYNDFQNGNMKNMIYNNNMVINQTINTNDAMQAANQSNNLIQETQNNAFQSQVLGEL